MKFNLICFLKERWQKKEKKMIKHKCSIEARHIAPNGFGQPFVADLEALNYQIINTLTMKNKTCNTTETAMTADPLLVPVIQIKNKQQTF